MGILLAHDDTESAGPLPQQSEEVAVWRRDSERSRFAAAAVAAGSGCSYEGFHRGPYVTSWEFQMLLNSTPWLNADCGYVDVDAAGADIAQMLQRGGAGGVRLQQGTVRGHLMEVLFLAISDANGKPLGRRRATPRVNRSLPGVVWHGLGAIRRRRNLYRIRRMANSEPRLAGAAHGAVMRHGPGMRHSPGDVTLKLWDVREGEFDPAALRLRRKLHIDGSGRSSRLKRKIENDVHCAASRLSFSATYSPVSQHTEVSTVGEAARFFPDLPALLDCRRSGNGSDDPLHVNRTASQFKAVWDVQIAAAGGAAIPAVANLVVACNMNHKPAGLKSSTSHSSCGAGGCSAGLSCTLANDALLRTSAAPASPSPRHLRHHEYYVVPVCDPPSRRSVQLSVRVKRAHLQQALPAASDNGKPPECCAACIDTEPLQRVAACFNAMASAFGSSSSNSPRLGSHRLFDMQS